MFEWHKKERPFLGIAGFGGGASSRLIGGFSLGPTTLSDYPLPTGSYQVFSSEWPGSPTNLPVSDSPTTFTVPSAALGYVRVIVVGGASGSGYGPGNAGNGAYIDALIPVTNGNRFKCIVGGGGATSSSSGRGGHGLGGGVGVDENDSGAGGGGSGFFFAEPGATSDPAMFPFGVLIAGGGGGGNTGTPAGSDPSGPSPDPIGGFNGIFRGGTPGSQVGEPGRAGGIGGRFRNATNSFNTPNAARGVGGSTAPDPYGGSYGGGGGGGSGGGGGGGIGNGNFTAGESATGDGGRGFGYNSYNTSGAGRGGDYPMRGGNGFRFNGVNLGAGGGGSHGRSHAGGGWGGGGGSYYDYAGGSGGSGAWGYVPGTATIQGWTPSSSIPVRGGTVNSVMSVPTSLGSSNGNPGYIVVMW